MKTLLDRSRFAIYGWVGLGIFLLCMTVQTARHPHDFFSNIGDNLWEAGYITILNYVLFEYTLPRLSRKRIGRSFLLILLHVILIGKGMFWWGTLGNRIFFAPEFKTIKYDPGDAMFFGFFSFLVFGITRHIYQHIKLRNTAQQLRIEKQEAELNYLKSQTNPHFLFNTLNNIYSLARDKSDLAPESILRLSKMLRYMLYEAGGAFIAIEQELKIIGDYIELEKLRYDQSLRVNFNYNVEDMRQALPPLLLIPLVENAFKHGVSETRHQPYVDIHLSVAARLLSFSVKNSTEDTAAGNVRENIGLSNLRRQLELQYNDYSLSIERGEYEFAALLKINLASHV